MKTHRIFVWKYLPYVALFILFSGLIGSCDRISQILSSGSEDDSGRSVVQTPWQPPEEDLIIESSAPAPKQKSAPSKVEPPAAVKKTQPDVPAISSQSEFYYLQAGAFRKRKNAENFIQSLKKSGYHPILFIQTTKDATWYTVRLGAGKDFSKVVKTGQEYADKQNADVAVIFKNQIKKVLHSKKQNAKSYNAALNNPSAEKTFEQRVEMAQAEELMKADTSKKLYAFQVGGLLTKPIATRQRNKLKAKGYNVFILDVPDKLKNEMWSTVQIGYFENLLDAASAARQFTQIENIPTQARHIYDFHKNF